MTPNLQTESRHAKPTLSALHNLALHIRHKATRGARAVGRCLDAFYLPTDAQERKGRLSPDNTDAIRLHGLGVRW